jgi:hypothetical protein
VTFHEVAIAFSKWQKKCFWGSRCQILKKEIQILKVKKNYLMKKEGQTNKTL